MKRLMLMAALASACGTDPDPRKPTSDVVVLEIMKPSCGQVQCHSSTTATEGLVFDTIEGTKNTIATTDNGDKSHVMRAIEWTGDERMPPDFPLQHADLILIDTWLNNGMVDTLP